MAPGYPSTCRVMPHTLRVMGLSDLDVTGMMTGGERATMGSCTSRSDLADYVADLSPDMICLCVDSVITYLNPAGRVLLDRKADGASLIGKPLIDIIHIDYQPILEDGLGELVEADSLPLMLVDACGHPVEVEMRVLPIPAEALGQGAMAGTLAAARGPAYLVHAHPVGERMQAVQEILESERRYRSLVNLALDFMCLVDGQGRITLANKSAQVLLDLDADTLMERTLPDIVHPDYQAMIELGLETLAGESGLLPLKFVDRQGEAIDVEARFTALGRADSFMLEARDIRQQLRSAEAVREREQRLQGILDTVAEAIISADDMGIIQSFNRAAEAIFGYSSSEVVGRNLSVLMPEPHASHHDGYMKTFRSNGASGVLGKGRELEGRRKDGSIFPLELNVTELRLGRNRLLTGIIRDITDRKRAEEAERRYKEELEQKVEERTRDLRRLSRQTQGILDSAGDGIVGLDMDGKITFANPAAAAMLGYEQGDLQGRAANEVFLAGEGRRKGKGLRIRAAMRLGVMGQRIEQTLVARTGHTFDAEYAASPIEDDGDISGVVVVFRDISDRKAAEARLKVAGTVFETTAEGILVSDARGRISMANAACARITGWMSEQCLDRTVQEVLFPGNEPVFEEMVAELMARQSCELEFWSSRLDGGEYAARLAASVVPDSVGTSHRIVIVVNDITQRKRDEERIRFQANYDSLTGLPNRALFNDRLDQAVSAARRAGTMVGLMFIDLDGFKAVNDTLGHDAGDLLLKGAAGRLRKCVRESDTVARLGGDEFTIIMGNLDSPEGAGQVAGRIIESLTVPFDLSVDDGKVREGRVSASIGIAVLPNHGDTSDDILRHADAAMYHAKEQGKANYQFFRPELLD
ncbi:PAS domain S-box-containing protein/diguanylate cyclase (GGDEF) domain-containing protein [Insolitispirillum peregrinum]|uniref:Sensor protein FixL n=1 Tax=Insolitispirillum peregrinum TaxID=80876 RepID=A0A1N7NNK3_9PROT|nr:PAS domain S-box-containing protein/diguanylate cyclase (GGDEF) domain-containing protein [Insolitispirillum peregrinum]